MGSVYLAHDEREDREVALKVLRSYSPDALRRVRREAEATNALDPSRVARVLDVGQTEAGEIYLVMEYVRGSTARALLRAGRPSASVRRL
jgi:serine/threonine-protein kinase